MRGLLNPDNPVMHAIGLLGYSIYLNLLWFVCSIPIITIGASTTALYYACGKLVRGEGATLTKAFFSSFRKNFKQATIIWLIMLLVGAILGADGYILYRIRFNGVFWVIMTALFVGAAIVYGIVLLWIFPLVSRFFNTTPMMFKNSLAIGVRYAICTIITAGVYIIMGYLIINIFTPFMFLGVGACAMVSSALMRQIFETLANTGATGETDLTDADNHYR